MQIVQVDFHAFPWKIVEIVFEKSKYLPFAGHFINWILLTFSSLMIYEYVEAKIDIVHFCGKKGYTTHFTGFKEKEKRNFSWFFIVLITEEWKYLLSCSGMIFSL